MSGVKLLTVSADEGEQRLDKWFKRRFPALTHGRLEKLLAAKGKKAVRLDLKKEKPVKKEILALILGPSGNLRAPAIRKGKLLLVGFCQEAYAAYLA